jgi:ribonuclease P protein component
LLARIQTSAQFAAIMRGTAVHAAGKIVSKSTHFALHALQASTVQGSPNGLPHAPSIGVIVPKRMAKRAVTRNTIKRQIYAVSAAIQTQIQVNHYVVRLRAPFAKETYPSATSEPLKRCIRAELDTLFAKVCTP